MTDLSHYVFENAHALGADVPQLIEVVQETFNEESQEEQETRDDSQEIISMKHDFFSYASERYYDVDETYNESY